MKINIINKSINANKIKWKPKNIILQAALKKICTRYIINNFFSKLAIQTFQIAIDINKYKKLQTGPKTQLGGLKLGKIISEYQGSLKELVTNPPKKEAEKVIKSIKINEIYLFFTIN